MIVCIVKNGGGSVMRLSKIKLMKSLLQFLNATTRKMLIETLKLKSPCSNACSRFDNDSSSNLIARLESLFYWQNYTISTHQKHQWFVVDYLQSCSGLWHYFIFGGSDSHK